MRGGVEGDFGRAAQQIGSAAVSAQLSLQVFADGRNTTAATDIALSDMLEEVDQAVSATADREVDTPTREPCAPRSCRRRTRLPDRSSGDETSLRESASRPS